MVYPFCRLRTYADTQSADEAHLLRQQYREADYHAATGCLLRPNYLPRAFVGSKHSVLTNGRQLACG
jgi:hypothetical protein